MAKEYINPPGLYKHPAYTRILKVTKPSTMIFISGQTPADDNYKPLYPGDLRAQYIAVIEALTLELEAAGATWDDVVFKRSYVLDVDAFIALLRDPTLPRPWNPERPSPSTLLGVTRLSNPGFLVEIEILAALSD